MKRSFLCCWLACAAATVLGAQDIPSPEAFLGHRVGADRRLAPYPKVLEYLRLVDAASDRVSMELAGRSTLGKEMPVVVLTSAANQERLDRFRDIARRLAHPDGLGAEAAEALIAEGKVIALVTCTIHATEVGSTQMVMELVHQLATTEDPVRLAWMDEVVLLLIPSLNPDGQVLVVDWYEKYRGTPYEGGRMPWLYHHYVGHDNNRDFYMLTQQETRVVNEVLYTRWFPQVFLDEHQMGSAGPRMFVPPQTDPVAAEVHSLIFRQADLLGTNMSRRLEEAGKRGVGHDMIFDSYWPGATRNTAWWKNVTGLLTEVASARVASPVFVDPGELRGSRKGLPDYTRRANYPSPWEGGWWHLRDIVDYELIATWAFVESCAENRADLLRNMYRMASEAIDRGRSEPPYAFVIPPGQHDPVAAALLVELLLRHGVRVMQAEEPVTVGFATYPAGTPVVSASQPYRAFLLTMLRSQRYPQVRDCEGCPVSPPYDVTSWSLPLSMGVEIVEAEQPPQGSLAPLTAPPWPGGPVAPAPGGYVVPHSADSVYNAVNRLLAAGRRVYWLAEAVASGAKGDLYISPGEVSAEAMSELATRLHLPVRVLESAPGGELWEIGRQRIGLYKPWMASLDEGWTRWLLERYEFPFVNLSNEDIRSGKFAGQIDVLLLPDVGKDIIADGRPADEELRRRWGPLPPPYAGGLDGGESEEGEGADEVETGGKRIREWIEAGGAAVALDSASGYLIDLLELPVVDVLAEVSQERFYCPGSMLRLLVDVDHPLGFGLRREEAAYFAESPAFRTFVPDLRFDRRVAARYPERDGDILLSGYLRGAELLERRAAAIDFEVGKGRVVLIGFRAQHRAQTHRTFKLLFNALYLPGLEKARL